VVKHKKGLIAAAIIVVLVVADILGPLRVTQVSIRLAAEPIFRAGGLTVTNTLLSSWLATVLLLLLALLVSRRLVDAPQATSLQNIVEAAFETLYNFMQSMVGPKARSFFPVVATFFLFILTSDWLGLLPGFGSVGVWTEYEGRRTLVPLLRGATTDLNTTLALAMCSVLSMQVYGARYLGILEYGSRFVAVSKFVAFFRALLGGKRADISLLFAGFLDVFVGILEILDELTKVLSFSFRLFGNMFGGEVLLIIMAFLVPYVASLPFLLMELFIGFIQAFIFAVLTTAFLGRATTRHGYEQATQ
jgi:F-type H+-transporting ATPase subunit a